jgi:hypothetical protein
MSIGRNASPRMQRVHSGTQYYKYFLFLFFTTIDVMEYLRKQAAKFHKSQIQIINDLVREKLAVGI